jgi:hypothetical protein
MASRVTNISNSHRKVLEEWVWLLIQGVGSFLLFATAYVVAKYRNHRKVTKLIAGDSKVE